jgi:hypothetical protein
VSTGWLEALSETGRLLAFRPGCTSSTIHEAEARLGVSLPTALWDLLQSTDGFADLESRYEYGWSLDTILAENDRAWSDEATPLDRALLAFGADGAGDWFCIPVGADDGPIYHWSWIDAEAREVGTDLRSFWLGWLRGTTKV